MSAHDPQDQHHDAPVPPVRPASAAGGTHHDAPVPPVRPASAPDVTPSVRDLLASCAAARTVSTPPAEPPAPSRDRDAA